MPKLSGRVSLGDGSAATSAVVEVHNSQGDVVDQVQVDDDGRYTYHLSEGTWSLNIWDNQGNRGQVEVQLGGDDTERDLQIGSA